MKHHWWKLSIHINHKSTHHSFYSVISQETHTFHSKYEIICLVCLRKEVTIHLSCIDFHFSFSLRLWMITTCCSGSMVFFEAIMPQAGKVYGALNPLRA
jgi:hypothetical protein